MAELLLDALEPLLPCSLPHSLLRKGRFIVSDVRPEYCLIALFSGGQVRLVPPGSTRFCFYFCLSGRVEVWLLSLGVVLLPSWACRTSCGRCICLVSCSTSLIKRWLVRWSASISFVLSCIVSSAPAKGQLSKLPCWSCILGGLMWLLLVFRVDTINY